MVERSDSKLELIARELKRLREERDEDVTRLRDWILRLDAEMDRLWHELGLRRARREGSQRTTYRKD